MKLMEEYDSNDFDIINFDTEKLQKSVKVITLQYLQETIRII